MLLHPLDFVIFGHARSGTTTLRNLLECCGVSIINEPFNPHVELSLGTQYIQQINVLGIKNVLDQLYSKYKGIKTLENQMDFQSNIHILTRPKTRIIFLQRRNWLRTVVSRRISGFYNVYQPNQLKGDWSDMVKQVPALDIDALREDIDKTRNAIKKYYEFSKNHNIDNTFFLVYEDLYENKDVHLAKKVIQFLGLRCNNEIIKQYLSDSHRMNSVKTYSLLKNAQQIENELGSQTNGWLFK